MNLAATKVVVSGVKCGRENRTFRLGDQENIFHKNAATC